MSAAPTVVPLFVVQSVVGLLHSTVGYVAFFGFTVAANCTASPKVTRTVSSLHTTSVAQVSPTKI